LGSPKFRKVHVVPFVTGAQVPLPHIWQVGQLPVWQVPPHPSDAPHAFPAQLGVQPQTPGVPPPPQVCGAVQVVHTPPPVPQALLVFPG